MSFDKLAADTIASHPHPGDDPAARLRHALDIYADAPDDRMVLQATSGIYGDQVVTGLTMGDLRAIAGKIGA